MYDGPVIDCDVHHATIRSSDLLPYMSRGWQEYVHGPGREGDIAMYVGFGVQNPHGFFREDEYPEEGGPPGSSPGLLRRNLLDKCRIDRAVLTYSDELYCANLSNP